MDIIADEYDENAASTRVDTLYSLKALKNSIVGNPVAKNRVVTDKSVPLVVGWLNATLAETGDEENELLLEKIRIEAAHVVSSLAYDSPSGTLELLRYSSLQALLHAILHLQPDDSFELRLALCRALKSIVVSCAEIVGPSLWGLGREYDPDTKEAARSALEELFQIEALDTYLPLLEDTPVIATSIALLLASSASCWDSPHSRQILTDWQPPGERRERSRDSRGKRGWENSTLLANRDARAGGWVPARLLSLLATRDVKAQEASLLALSSLALRNPNLSSVLIRPLSDPDGVTPLAVILSFTNSRIESLRLAACLCAIRIVCSCPKPHSVQLSRGNSASTDVGLTLIAALNSMMSDPQSGQSCAMRASFLLAAMMAENKNFQESAASYGSMGILLKLLAEVQPVPDDSEWAEEESEVTARLREGVLTALATMTLGLEKIREVLTNSPLFIPYVMAAMSDAHVGVRLAACQCVRSLSRSVQVLRTSIVDSGLGLKLFEMMRKEQDKRVQSVALMGISNLVLDFSPLREKLVEMGALSKIIALLDDPDELLQINAIWAIKNAIYKASFEEKRNIFNQLKWETFRSLLCTTNPQIREQAIGCCRNMTTGPQETALLLSSLGEQQVIEALQDALEGEYDPSAKQAAGTLKNIANTTPNDSILLSSRISLIEVLRDRLRHSDHQVREYVIDIIENLTSHPGRCKDLKNLGLESALREMIGLRNSGMGSSDSAAVEAKAKRSLTCLLAV